MQFLYGSGLDRKGDYFVYFVGDAVDALAAPVDFFAFFFLVFFVLAFAGAGVAADAEGAGGEAAVVPWASATAENAAATSAAIKSFIKTRSFFAE